MLSDADYAALQEALLRRPRQGDLIRETGGIRKLRGETQVEANAARFESSTTGTRGMKCF